jgi:hypothetical protein
MNPGTCKRCTISARHRRAVLVLAVTSLLAACGAKNQASAAAFVGKWKSSKLTTPLYLYPNGEWEIKTDEGGVLQFGLWEYQDGRLVWLFKSGARISRDVNPVIAVTDREFQLREGSLVTVFNRLD